jgi:hypothetical protein
LNQNAAQLEIHSAAHESLCYCTVKAAAPTVALTEPDVPVTVIVYRRYNIVDMEVLKNATAKIEEHQREIVQAENNHRTAIVSTKDGADDKTDPVN